MAKNVITMTISNTSGALIGNVVRNRNHRTWFGMLAAWGTFGGGAVTFFISPDNGTTLIPIVDAAYSAVSYSANSMANTLDLATGSHNNDHLQIYAKLTGATNPNLIVGFYDNN